MRDEAWLLDIFNAARKIRVFTDGLDEQAFHSSELHQSAVVKQLEIIGEAASRVSQVFRDAHPEIPWKQIIGMRHRLVHDYTNINVDTVWETTQRDIDSLISQMQPFVPDENMTDGTNSTE